jgi:hypothetical protein
MFEGRYYNKFLLEIHCSVGISAFLSEISTEQLRSLRHSGRKYCISGG